jgi:hypothetical protein
MKTVTSERNIVEVRNRNNGYTCYTLDDGTSRVFTLNEIKKIDLEELRSLSMAAGGDYILKNYLMINDKNALEYLDLNPEPEYFYTEKDIEDLLLNKDPDYLEDCLNFAPQGVIDLVKSMAVKLAVPDTRKRKLILEKTGFSVDNALHVNEVLNEEEEEKKPEVKAERKVKRTEEDKSDAKPARKIVIPKE